MSHSFRTFSLASPALLSRFSTATLANVSHSLPETIKTKARRASEIIEPNKRV